MVLDEETQVKGACKSCKFSSPLQLLEGAQQNTAAMELFNIFHAFSLPLVHPTGCSFISG